MPTYKRPGVYTDEVLQAINTVDAGNTNVAAFLGEHFRGPTDEAVLVRSWTEFVTYYGGFPSTGTPTELPYGVYNFFTNGGRFAYIARVTGSGGASSSVTLQDRAGSPVDTLTVTAKNEGTWGDAIRVDIVDRDAANGTFDLNVYNGGTTSQFLVERWINLSMTDADDRFVETIINEPDSGSKYITVTDEDSGTASPNDMPSAQTGTALTGGADASAAVDAEKQAAVTQGTSLLDDVDGMLTISYPGEYTVAVIDDLITYCADRGTAFAVVDPQESRTPAQAVTYIQSLTESSYGAVYWPWLKTPDPNSTTPGATRWSPPGPFIAGKMSEVDTAVGVWKAPAGLNVRVNNTVDVQTKATNAELDTLNEANVNAIRRIPGSGIVVMGARTMKTTDAAKYINVRRTLNYVKDTLTASTDFAIFENNDQALWNRLSNVAERFLSGVWQLGGLRGGSPGEAFYVKCDEEINTLTEIQQGIVKLEVGVALQFPAEFVVITVGQFEGGSATSEG